MTAKRWGKARKVLAVAASAAMVAALVPTAALAARTPTSKPSVTVAGKKAVYDGEGHGLTVTAPSGYKVYYSKSKISISNAAEKGSEASPTRTKVGRLKVHYAVVPETGKATAANSRTGLATVTVSKRSLSSVSIADVEAQAYTGKAVKPELDLTYNGTELVAGKDYTVSYARNKYVGTAKALVQGKGNFKGAETVKYRISKAATTEPGDTPVDDPDSQTEADKTNGEAYVVYSADDSSLSFYKRIEAPVVGEVFNGKIVTAVYAPSLTTAYNTNTNTVPWSSRRTSTISATVVDEGLTPQYLDAWFYGFSALKTADLSKLDASQVESSLKTFYNCSSLTNLDAESWNVSSLSNAQYMFYNCSSLVSLDLSGWNTTSLANTSQMFNKCSSLASVDLSGWITSSCTNMGSMFSGCTSLARIYAGSGWNTSSVGASSNMFYECSQLPTFNSAATTAARAYYCGDGKGYLICKTAPTAFAVYSADDNSLNFYNRLGSEVPLCSEVFNGKTVTAVYGVNVVGPYSSTTSAPWYSRRGSTVSVTVVDEGISPQSLYSWFYGFSALKTADLSKLDVSNVVSTVNAFYNCSSLVSLDLSGWKTTSLGDITQSFYNCSSLVSLDLSGWDTSKVGTAKSAFNDCSSLVSLDLSGWDTAACSDMSYAFSDCSSLSEIYAGDLWNVDSVTADDNMFYNCTSLPNYNGAATRSTKAYYGGDGNGYLTYKAA